jgi:hypothetical protein
MFISTVVSLLSIAGGVVAAPAPRGNADLKVFADAFVGQRSLLPFSTPFLHVTRTFKPTFYSLFAFIQLPSFAC